MIGSPSRRAVYKGDMTYGAVSIPVAIYKARDCYAMNTNLFHAGCDAPIRQPLTCPEHPLEEKVETYSGITLRDKVVPVPSELKDTLLGRKQKLEIISSHKMKDLASLINSGTIAPLEMYELTGQRSTPHPTNTDSSHVKIASLLSRLSVKRRFLTCRIGLGGMERLAILLPSGIFYTLSYDEELRDRIGLSGKPDRTLSRHLDDLILNLDAEFYAPSLAEIDSRVTRWIVSALNKVSRTKKETHVRALTY